jgi:hypothetical protein
MLKRHNFQKAQINTVVMENMLSSYNRYNHLLVKSTPFTSLTQVKVDMIFSSSLLRTCIYLFVK